MRRLISTCCRNFSTEKLNHTPLFKLHNELGGKMVPFAGYALPVQYEGLGVLKEHVHTRSAGCASLFDVSHMGQIKWLGKDAGKFLERFVISDILGLKAGETKLSVILKEDGNILDDTMVTNAGDHLFMVVNGACKEKDLAYFSKQLMAEHAKGLDVSMTFLAYMSLLALQGDGAKAVMARLAPDLDLSKMNFMTSTETTVAGIPDVRVSRCGYTGEDGFELSVHELDAEELARKLLAEPEVKPAGLGSRDSLRLEAGLCLYGHDLDEQTNPVQGSLAWVMGGPTSRRRVEQTFVGASTFLEPNGKLKPVARKRVGITGMKAPAREGCKIFSGDTEIGVVTSGGFGPTCNKPIAMGYVKTEFSADGADVAVEVRGKKLPAKVSKMPFVAHNYYKVK